MPRLRRRLLEPRREPPVDGRGARVPVRVDQAKADSAARAADAGVHRLAFRAHVSAKTTVQSKRRVAIALCDAYPASASASTIPARSGWGSLGRSEPDGEEHPFMAGTVNSQSGREAHFHCEGLVGQWQLSGKARNSHCGPTAVIDAVHSQTATTGYWITSSARMRSDDGSLRPRALAARRLTISRYSRGCSTGRSAAFAPLRILST